MTFVFSLPSGASLHVPAASLQSATLTAKQTHPDASFVGISFQS